MPDGSPKPAGTRIVNPGLAVTLEAVAKGGRDAFYTGPVAEQIVARVRTAPTNPAPMTLDDLKAYEAKQRAAGMCALSGVDAVHHGAAIGRRHRGAADPGAVAGL